MRIEILVRVFKNAFFFIVDLFPLITFVVSFLFKKGILKNITFVLSSQKPPKCSLKLILLCTRCR